MKREQILPTVLIAIDVLAALGYIPTGEWRKVGYWFFAAGITFCATF